MGLERRTVCFDNDLKIEAFRFEGIMQKFPNHFHEHYVLGFVESGSRHLNCKNRKYTINSGDLLLFNPLDNHACEQVDDRALDWRCLNIEKDVMSHTIREITGKEYLPIFASNVVYQSEIVPALRDLHDMIMNGREEAGKEEAFYFLIKQLISEYTESITENHIHICSEIMVIRDYMENNYSETITLSDLSNISGLNKYTLLRNFTMQFGITPYQYLSTIRVNKAKSLLESGMSLVETAMQTGFTDQSHFTKFFKNFIGLTPKLYQNIFLSNMENNKKGD